MASCHVPLLDFARQKIKRAPPSSCHGAADPITARPGHGRVIIDVLHFIDPHPFAWLSYGQIRMPLVPFPSSSDPSRSRRHIRHRDGQIIRCDSQGITLTRLRCTHYKHGPFVAECLLSAFASSPPAETTTPDCQLVCLSNTHRSGRMRIRRPCLEPVIVQARLQSRRHADHMAPPLFAVTTLFRCQATCQPIPQSMACSKKIAPRPPTIIYCERRVARHAFYCHAYPRSARLPVVSRNLAPFSFVKCAVVAVQKQHTN
ncbi:hypothetical protein COCMIDRAFT_30710 [Bipolaris oryzae ATCC 44560]|uniref:Uncharacterized protein n=1 Tax=Bipolaris oryzae ATCC 44560 TaxID=930090 RepID=W6Z9H7_COCMI|nr:uncharacterized protein COCMIDRAFT_30710 [Bipolaris oryzae ATCC 44560]EUC40336.1 hypothetical protein COCMIDRAFT_30710 [Bipolaris oryzae ATCC 44560]